MSLTSDTLLCLLFQPCIVSLPSSLPLSFTWCFFFPLTAREPLPHLGTVFSHLYLDINLWSYRVQTHGSESDTKILCVFFFFYCSVCVHKVLVCTCQCLCVSSDAWGCCWDFTAQHAAYHHLQFKWACMRHPVRLKQPSSPLCLIGGNHSSHLQVNPTISYWLLYWKKWAVKLLCMKQYHRGKIF